LMPREDKAVESAVRVNKSSSISKTLARTMG
jgi:hypothetical protein